MKAPHRILFSLLLLLALNVTAQQKSIHIDFFGESIAVPAHTPTPAFNELSEQSIEAAVAAINTEQMQPYLDALTGYTQKAETDDWLYYQLVRRVAQQLSPKAANYYRYTVYKYWLLLHSGYDARLTYSGNYLLLYVQSNESIYNIPYRMQEGKQYVCLNYHDYGSIDFAQNRFHQIPMHVAADARPFSYKVVRLPQFASTDYTERQVEYEDGGSRYRFRIKVNPQIKTLFTNYPVVDYSLQFNIPLSGPTYQSLIPSLQKEIKGLKPKEGVDFLMRFTRYAFLFKNDSEIFGSEKRMSAEQTLLSEFSDCEDRAALFFFLVKEIYNLPMLVITYPKHVTVAVQFDKPFGNTIEYNGMKYSVCEPSPQRLDLSVGQMLPELKNQAYEIAYAYKPGH